MRLSCFIIIFSGLLSCSPAIQREISKSSVFAQNHTGFYLVNPESGKVLVDLNGAKYFTPASNTKIFTFFTSLNILGDSVPALSYAQSGDSLIIWGTGDPSLLNPEFEQGNVYSFLRAFDSVYFSPTNFHDDFFGAGWAWDDYMYSFQPEKSPFPMYGNMVHFSGKKDSALVVNPGYFSALLQDVPAETEEENYFTRDPHTNTISYHLGTDEPIEEAVPFRATNEVLEQLLSDTLARNVQVRALEKANYEVTTLFSIPSDSLYKQLMQVSDNFVAEQLMLMNAGILSDSLDVSIAIRYSQDSLLEDSPDPLIWVDGSGLSRYNLFTPRSIVYVWQKISEMVAEDRLYALLPSGGVSGTLEDWYQSDPPYIYGKTGTLSNNHCLSGFIKTKSGKTLVFSFMNNNYRYGSSTIKQEMERILKHVYEKY